MKASLAPGAPAEGAEQASEPTSEAAGRLAVAALGSGNAGLTAGLDWAKLATGYLDSLGFSRQIEEILRPSALRQLNSTLAQFNEALKASDINKALQASQLRSSEINKALQTYQLRSNEINDALNAYQLRWSQINENLAAVFSAQARIGLSIGQVARLIQPAQSADLMRATLASRNGLRDVMGVAIAADGLGVVGRQASLTLNSFSKFTASVVGGFPATGGSEAASSLAVEELAAGGAILEDAAAGLWRFERVGSEDERSVDIDVLPPTAYEALADEVDGRRDELLHLSREELATELRSLTALQISRAATQLLILRYRCSQARTLATGHPTFSSTLQTDYAAGMLPQWVVRTEEDFKQFIDLLFKFIYESSGDLTRINGDVVARHDVLLAVKHLRHYYRHDQSRGADNEAAKKLRRVGEIFKELVGVRVLTSRVLWQRAQLRLLNRLVEALEDQLRVEVSDASEA